MTRVSAGAPVVGLAGRTGQRAFPARLRTKGKARHDLEHSPEFRNLVKWRTGCEDRISHLKRRYGWDRSLVAGRERTATWCGYGVLAHNLVKVARLEAKTA